MKTTNYDVVVCGGGPSGVAAAVSAARSGARTLLIERYGFCGGMATAALVNPWSGHEYTDPGTGRHGSLIGGFFAEVVMEMDKRGAYGAALSPAAFDEEMLKYVYDQLLLEAGVKVQFHTYLESVEMEEEAIQSIQVFSKAGKERFLASVFIDCSGDADLAANAGISFEVGRSEDGLTQAMTVSFRMANVDKAEMQAKGNLRKARALVEPYFQAALAKGDLVYPYRPFIHFYDYPRAGVLHFNMTRITEVSGLSANDLSHAEMEGRRQAFLIAGWLQQSVPWFKNAYLEKVACQVGVRETRHIKGLYTLTQNDITEARKFEDGIARSRYFIDIHNPKGSHDVQQKEGKQGELRKDFGPPEGDYYEIPFRCLVSHQCSNLIVACRALSATHEAAAAARVMATMHGIGEAAGVAASYAVSHKISVSEIPGSFVRKQIDYLQRGPDFGHPWTAESGFPWTQQEQKSAPPVSGNTIKY